MDCRRRRRRQRLDRWHRCVVVVHGDCRLVPTHEHRLRRRDQPRSAARRASSSSDPRAEPRRSPAARIESKRCTRRSPQPGVGIVAPRCAERERTPRTIATSGADAAPSARTDPNGGARRSRSTSAARADYLQPRSVDWALGAVLMVSRECQHAVERVGRIVLPVLGRDGLRVAGASARVPDAVRALGGGCARRSPVRHERSRSTACRS